MMDALQLLAGLLLALAAYILHARSAYQRRSKACPLPPTPPHKPFIGLSAQMMDLSTAKPWQKFDAWRALTTNESNQTNDHCGLLHVPTVRQTNIVVSKASVAYELLERRGANYAGRLPAPFVAEMVNKDMILANSNDPKRLMHDMARENRVKRLRRLLHEQFSQVGSLLFHDIQREENVLLLDDLLHRPTSSDDCFTDSKHRLVARYIYGPTSTVPHKQLWAFLKKTEARPIPAIAPLLTPFPWLRHWPRWAPGGGFHQVAEDYHREDCAVWEKVRDDVKQALDSGAVGPGSSMLARMYASDAPKRLGFSDLEMAFVAANLFIAGGDLPEVTLRIFTFCMLHAPEAMSRAQEELDSVVGRERLPDFEDKNDLPYTRALILEMQRWRPLSGIGVGHTNYQDDWFDGYFIPKGSVIFPDLYAMSRDSSLYPEPEKFKPERFLNEDGTVNRKHELATFGYGHRICSARILGENIVFLNVASLLWAFNIQAPLDARGQRVLPNEDMNAWKGINPCQPQPFVAHFVPRGASVSTIVRDAKEGIASG